MSREVVPYRMRGTGVSGRMAALLAMLAIPLSPAPGASQEPHGVEAGVELVKSSATATGDVAE